VKVLVWNYHPGHFWVRVLGKGLVIKDTRRWPLLFSERYGYTRRWRIGRIAIGYLS
jgi:hypothetical protein